MTETDSIFETTSETMISWESTIVEGGTFINCRPGINKTVRLIGEPVKTYKVFIKKGSKNICIMINSEAIGEDLKSDYPDRIDKVSVRFICYCIDREDGKIKLLDMPPSLAQIFGARVEALGKPISKREGADFLIKTNGKTGMECRYTAIYIEPTTLTDEEVETFKKVKKDLFELYEGKSQDDAVLIIEG